MIGERLREVRKSNRMKQTELAELLGVRNAAISRYESEKDTPSDANKVKLARYFNISLDYLLGVIDEPVSYYTSDKFVNLPKDLRPEQLSLLNTFVTFLEFQNNH